MQLIIAIFILFFTVLISILLVPWFDYLFNKYWDWCNEKIRRFK